AGSGKANAAMPAAIATTNSRREAMPTWPDLPINADHSHAPASSASVITATAAHTGSANSTTINSAPRISAVRIRSLSTDGGLPLRAREPEAPVARGKTGESPVERADVEVGP